MSERLQFIDSDPETILRRMEDVFYAAGGSVLWPGDEKQITLQTLAYCFAWQRAALNAAGLSMLLQNKTGTQLNSEGESRGVDRIQAVSASVPFEAVFSAGKYEIPALAQFTSDGSAYYKAKISFPAISAQGVTVRGELEAVMPGAAGNALAAGVMLTPVDGIPGLMSIKTTGAAHGGSDEEGDDVYRERIRTGGTVSVAGPASAYEALTRGVSANIIDAKATRLAPQNVLVTILCEVGSETDALIGEVTRALSSDDVRPLNDIVTVREAQTVPYSVTVRYKAAAGEEASTRAAIEAAAAEYQAWQDRRIGRAIDAYRLLSLCIQTGAPRVELKNAPAYQTLTETQVAAGTITFEEMA